MKIELPELNFPKFIPKLIQGKEGRTEIYDPIRKKFVALTPEEWVRQNLIAFLTATHGYPSGLMAVERSLTFNKLNKRFDLLVYNKQGQPLLMAECKANSVALSRETLFQIATYNSIFAVPYLFVTNGLNHLLFHLGTDGKYRPEQEFPKI